MNDTDEDILRENLRVPALSPEAMARIRRATEAEWRAQVGVSKNRWIPRVAAAAVLLIAGAAALQSWLRPTTEAQTLATLTRADGAGVTRKQFWHDEALAPGSRVSSGSDYQARGSSLLALAGGGNVRLAPGAKFEVLSANSLRLERGDMYVDIPPGQHAAASFVAITGAGEFRHVGTQFALSVDGATTRLRVREGRVQWHAANGESTVPAGTEVLIQPSGVTRSSIDSTGEDWAWTQALAPEIVIENRPLMEFLNWFARETGRTLVITDPAARQQAQTTLMHGSVHGLTPEQALKAVMASTSLRFDLPAGAIRVSFAGEPKPTTT